MKAYQCDRCFHYYTTNKEVSIPGHASDIKAARVAVMSEEGSGGAAARMKKYELCDDCMKKIVNFLTYKEEL